MSNSSIHPADEGRLRKLPDAARFLSVSLRQVYRLAEAGEIEMLKVGRCTRVQQASLDRFIKNAKRVVPK